MVALFSVVSFAQNSAPKRMWATRTYNLQVDSTAGNTYSWSLQGASVALTATGTKSIVGTKSNYAVSIATSASTPESDSILLTETNSSNCSKVNKMAIAVYPMPTFTTTSSPNSTVCLGSGLSSGTMTIASSNFSAFSSIANDSITIQWTLFNTSNTSIATGTGRLNSGTFTLNNSEISSVIASQTVTGDYFIRVTEVTTNPGFNASTSAYAAGAINTSNSTAFNSSNRNVAMIRINPAPASLTITPVD